MLPVIQASCPLINTDKPFCSTRSLHCPVSALLSKCVWHSWKQCVPNSPPPPSPHGLPANLFSLNVGSVIFIQPCQGLLSNCSGIWNDHIMEGKTDLCTFCFLKPEEQGLTGLLKHNLNAEPQQLPKALWFAFDDLKASVLMCYQRK